MSTRAIKFDWKPLDHIKRWLGWSDCPDCGGLVRFRFIHVTIIFPDEPPMFGRWECPHCGYLTPIGHSALVDDAVRKLGYKDFQEYAEKNLREK